MERQDYTVLIKKPHYDLILMVLEQFRRRFDMAKVLSEAHKAAMLAGRQNKKLGIIKEKPIKAPSGKKRGRPKGYVRDPETIRKQKETRLKNKLGIKDEVVCEKPALIISRKWQTGFDFWPEMRKTLRPLHRYAECQAIERLIVQKDIWENKEEIIKILENYFVIEMKKLKVSV